MIQLNLEYIGNNKLENTEAISGFIKKLDVHEDAIHTYTMLDSKFYNGSSFTIPTDVDGSRFYIELKKIRYHNGIYVDFFGCTSKELVKKLKKRKNSVNISKIFCKILLSGDDFILKII